MVAPRDYNAEYRDGARKYAYRFDTVLRRYIMRTLDPFFPPGRALEMGCYTGEMTELIAARYADVTVIEASEELVAVADARLAGRARFVRGTFETVDIADRYDAIFLIHTLEHLDDPVAVLRRVNGWLADRGRLFVAVPNANAASRQIAVHMGLIRFNDAFGDDDRALADLGCAIPARLQAAQLDQLRPGRPARLDDSRGARRACGRSDAQDRRAVRRL